MMPHQFQALMDVHNEQEDARRKFADYRAGVVAAVVVNSNPYRKQGAKALEPASFFPNLGPAQRHQTPEEMHVAMQMIAKRMKSRREADAT